MYSVKKAKITIWQKHNSQRNIPINYFIYKLPRCLRKNLIISTSWKAVVVLLKITDQKALITLLQKERVSARLRHSTETKLHCEQQCQFCY